VEEGRGSVHAGESEVGKGLGVVGLGESLGVRTMEGRWKGEGGTGLNGRDGELGERGWK